MKCRNEWQCFTQPLRYQAPFRVYWHMPLSKWMASRVFVAGNGRSSFLSMAKEELTLARIFILEGLVPAAMSLANWKLLPDNPETASFLNKHEKEFIINRLALETGSGRGRVTNQDKIKSHHIFAAFKEYKIWCAWVMFWANTIGVYGYGPLHR